MFALPAAAGRRWKGCSTSVLWVECVPDERGQPHRHEDRRADKPSTDSAEDATADCATSANLVLTLERQGGTGAPIPPACHATRQCPLGTVARDTRREEVVAVVAAAARAGDRVLDLPCAVLAVLAVVAPCELLAADVAAARRPVVDPVPICHVVLALPPEGQGEVDRIERPMSTPTIDVFRVANEADSQVPLDTRGAEDHAVRMSDAMEPLYKEFGRQVRSRRAALGWSQARLGDALRPPMTRASIANIEAGQQRVLLHTALDLAAALEVRFDDLVGRSPSAASAGADPELLAVELASKLSISSDQARTLASKVSRKNRSVKQ